MNERIKELWDKVDRQDEGTRRSVVITTETELQEFAELIIQDCVDILKKEAQYYDNPCSYESSEYYERCEAKAAAFEDAVDMLRSRFGVKL